MKEVNQFWYSGIIIRNSCNKIQKGLQLSVIIVNYNVKYFLEQCLCSVIKTCRNTDAEIIVIDNNSDDGSKEFFAGRFPQVQFIWKNENSGFAKANNEALSFAKGEKILFLNPDTVLPEDCFEKCLKFFDEPAKVGALGVRMIDGNGNFLQESKRGFPRVFTSFCKMTGLTRLFPHSKIFARYYLGHLPEKKINEVDILSGAFMMIERKVLDTAGSFDEDYFMYAEDIDLSYRIQKSGYKNYYFADTTIIHFKGESTVKQSAAYTKNFYGTMILFVKKHYRGLPGSIYVTLLKAFIAMKSLVALNVKSVENKTLQGKAFVISNEEAFKKNEPALRNYFHQTEKIEKVALAETCAPVIFFEPALSFKEIISQMQQYKNQYQFFIHADTTSSMVGSSDKNTPGSAFAL